MYLKAVRKMAKIMKYVEVWAESKRLEKEIEKTVMAKVLNQSFEKREGERELEMRYVESLMQLALFEKYTNS